MFSLSVLYFAFLRQLQLAYQACGFACCRTHTGCTSKHTKLAEGLCMRIDCLPVLSSIQQYRRFANARLNYPEYSRSATSPQPGSWVTRSASASGVSALCL